MFRYPLRTLLIWTMIGPPLAVAAISVAWATLNSVLEFGSRGFPLSRLPVVLGQFCAYGLGVTLPVAVVFFLAAIPAVSVDKARSNWTLLDLAALIAAVLATSFALATVAISLISTQL